MDLQVLGDGVGFKMRVGAVAVRDGRLLIHSLPGEDVWMTPGGCVAFGESSAAALRREMVEELGVDVEVGRLLWVVEHFFETSRRRWHQILWLHELAFPADCAVVRPESWAFDHGEGLGTFRWTPQSELAGVALVPGFLRGALRELPREPRRVVHVDSRS